MKGKMLIGKTNTTIKCDNPLISLMIKTAERLLELQSDNIFMFCLKSKLTPIQNRCQALNISRKFHRAKSTHKVHKLVIKHIMNALIISII